jgi:AcrR family transcriptional regulator
MDPQSAQIAEISPLRTELSGYILLDGATVSPDLSLRTELSGYMLLGRGPLMVTNQLRKDARRNRGAILDAARALFAELADVSMCEVARRAGVGQATLYRNFPDLGALTAEILVEHLEHITQIAAECAGDPGAFFILLRSLVEDIADLGALGEIARDDASVDSQIEVHRLRIAELMKRPLSDAKAAGTVRPDISLDDVFLVLLMARGARAKAQGAAARAVAANRALTLVLDGLVPPPRARA